ncbi:hypothetical protein Bca52824_070458 [Brassica carinata]|uniref:Uncharacterized protein n=1 Tax=Brassica carinata TaxID=52824 RepID=A0A8X7Q9B8_BRACI|nr:hypothetical protein Bca52824_070458 [Brassica carinata]
MCFSSFRFSSLKLLQLAVFALSWDAAIWLCDGLPVDLYVWTKKKSEEGKRFEGDGDGKQQSGRDRIFSGTRGRRRNLKKAKGSRAMATENNRADEIVFSQERESTGANKYGGLVPKKKPLISQPKRAFFDSADWVLHKQQASADERTIEAIESLRPKLVRTPHKQLPPRGPTFLTGQENLVIKSILALQAA